MIIQTPRHLFSVEDYHRMRVAGILAEDDRVELLAGEIRAMSPVGPYHAAVVKRLNHRLSQLLPATLLLSVQDPIQLSDMSEPEPDVAIVTARDDFYEGGHPTSDDIVLVIEVADTTIMYDRDEKLPRYAQAMLREVWIVDITSEQVEQYTDPYHNQYRTKRTWQHGEAIPVATIPAATIAIDDIFGVFTAPR